MQRSQSSSVITKSKSPPPSPPRLFLLIKQVGLSGGVSATWSYTSMLVRYRGGGGGGGPGPLLLLSAFHTAISPQHVLIGLCVCMCMCITRVSLCVCVLEEALELYCMYVCVLKQVIAHCSLSLSSLWDDCPT